MTRLSKDAHRRICAKIRSLTLSSFARQAALELIRGAVVEALPKPHRKLIDAGCRHHLVLAPYEVGGLVVRAPAGADPEALAADKALAARVRRRYPQRMRSAHHYNAQQQHWLQRLAPHTTAAKLLRAHPELGPLLDDELWRDVDRAKLRRKLNAAGWQIP